MSQSPQSPVALGVLVGADTIEAVLVRQAGDHAEVVQRFTRQRARTGALVGAESLQTDIPGLKGSDDDDYTLQVGDGSATGPAFLPSEFAGVGGARAGGAGAGGPKKGVAVSAAAGARPFTLQLREILRECASAGYDRPAVVFLVAPPEASYTELLVAGPAEEAAKPAGKAAEPAEPKKGRRPAADAAPARADRLSAGERKRLLALLKEQQPGADPERAAFVPLASAAGRRYLAVSVEATEPVVATLDVLNKQEQTAAPPDARRLDAEATLLAALVRRAHAPAEGTRTAVVRVGTEDTLLLFFDGAELAYVERLRSVTAYDLPDTVCSRVLLYQDEKKAGEPDTVVVASAGRGDLLLEKFRSYYPSAAVEPLEQTLGELGVRLPDDDAGRRAGALLATAAALRQLDGWDVEPDVDLLPARLRTRRRRAGAWHTALAAVLLVAALGVAALRYHQGGQEVNAIREELRRNPPVLPDENPDLLQARVDSLNHAFQTYTRSLDVLDSLLVGSDRWIQTMRTVTRSTDGTGGIWLNSWSPDGGMLRLNGQALDRPRIVELARRLDGAIEMVTYTDVGPTRVYAFDMVFPIPNEMPQVALTLRAMAGDNPDSVLADASERIVSPADYHP